MDWLALNWEWAAGAMAGLTALIYALLRWFGPGRRDGADDAVDTPDAPEAPRPRLEPNRPDIVPAARIDFSETAPAAAAYQVPPAAAPAVDASLAPAVDPILADAGSSDLRRIKGLGPKLVTLLAAQGITRIDQIAAWSDADIDAIDGQLGAFAGRPRRDQWVTQAKLLTSGDMTAYTAQFGAASDPAP